MHFWGLSQRGNTPPLGSAMAAVLGALCVAFAGLQAYAATQNTVDAVQAHKLRLRKARART